MAWVDDQYIRNLLDARERWGVLLSATAAAATLVFLAEHPHRPWVDVGPFLIGAFGSLYVLVVNCYYEQAEAIAHASGDDRDKVKAKSWVRFARRIGILGWLHILAPAIVGGIASLILRYGLTPAAAV